jgi:hypothetical protein
MHRHTHRHTRDDTPETVTHTAPTHSRRRRYPDYEPVPASLWLDPHTTTATDRQTNRRARAQTQGHTHPHTPCVHTLTRPHRPTHPLTPAHAAHTRTHGVHRAASSRRASTTRAGARTGSHWSSSRPSTTTWPGAPAAVALTATPTRGDTRVLTRVHVHWQRDGRRR